MTTDLEYVENPQPQRPLFLKVLCILTFIGSGYTVLKSTVTYFNANAYSELVISAKTKMYHDLDKKKTKDTASVNMATKIMNSASEISTPENLRKRAIGDILSAIFCLTGAVLMWRLKRIGFYIYILGTIIGIVAPFYLVGNNFLNNIVAGALSFIGIIFIIFYAMNIKSMK